MPFRTRTARTPAPDTPEALFRQLQRPKGGPPALWSHQADLLREYHGRHQRTPDVALELPTGAGKTLVGLLIAEWRRRRHGENVVYCCPTRQLAGQVTRQAATYGIDVVCLVGPSREWSPSDEQRYHAGDRSAVTTYAHVFNSNPRFDDADVLLLDDAHSGADYVGRTWEVYISREDQAYWPVLEILRESLDPIHFRRLEHDDPDARWRWNVDIVRPSIVHRHASDLETALGRDLRGSAEFSYRMMEGQLASCLLLVSWGGMSLRPLLPPTAFHAAFDDPTQRIYMSATLGFGGELERSFGRRRITRLPVPEGWDEQGVGRRFFLFPELTDADEEDVRKFVSNQMTNAGRALLLSPSSHQLDLASSELIPSGMTVVGADELEKDPSIFANRDAAVLALANRYDGIDLPDEVCRLIVLVGLPKAVDLLERFLVESVGASGVLRERIRTRVVQGAGRCTRNPSDYASVLVLGDDLVQFLSRREVQESTHRHIQAEVQFGLANSAQDMPELPQLVASFVEQDDAWRQVAEVDILERRAEARLSSPPGADQLAESAALEVDAQNAAWRGEWRRAVDKARDVLSRLEGGPEVRPYQALWNFLASQWATMAADTGEGDDLRAVAADFEAKAYASSRGSTWLQWSTRGDERSGERQDLLAAAAAAQLAGRFHDYARGSTLESAAGEIRAGLESGDAAQFERALRDLGAMLGATKAYKPSGEGRPDSVWVFGGELWIVWEAKNEQQAEGEVALSDIRQANTHLVSVAEDRGESVPPGSPVILVSPRDALDSFTRRLADEAVYLVEPDDLMQLLHDVTEAWRAVRALTGLSKDRLAARIEERFGAHNCIGESLIERLKFRQVRGSSA